jgi:formylglycine-generating enzyme required for sulfatase activity
VTVALQKTVVAAGAGRQFTNSLGMEFVSIEPGSFMMGSPANEPGRFDNEKQRRVVISDAFYMQTTEVTQGQWRKVMGNNPSYFKNCGDDCPVELVSLEEVQAFIKELNKLEGTDTYRLPTEAQWEYAARAGTTTALYNGPITILGERNAPALDPIAWYGGNSCVDYSGGRDSSGWDEKQYSCSKSGTHPVGKKRPNGWGLYDMLGNVWEWTQDIYEGGSRRVIRGGGWDGRARFCRSAYRLSFAPGSRGGDLGFRLARTK